MIEYDQVVAEHLSGITGLGIDDINISEMLSLKHEIAVVIEDKIHLQEQNYQSLLGVYWNVAV